MKDKLKSSHFQAVKTIVEPQQNTEVAVANVAKADLGLQNGMQYSIYQPYNRLQDKKKKKNIIVGYFPRFPSFLRTNSSV